MPTINVEAHLTPDHLLDAARQLSPNELETLVCRLLTLRKHQSVPALDEDESRLFEVINEGLPEETRERFVELKSRLKNRTMTPEEQQEFNRLTDEREKQNVRRLEALVELSKRRGVPLRELMDQLGVVPPPYE
jgi:hypothetical protein